MIRLSTVALILAAVAALLTAGCKKDDQAPDPAGKTETTPTAVVVDSVPSDDGVMIYYDTRGRGDKTLVFVHCWSCDRSYWSSQVDEFARDYRVVTVDLAGHGQSGLGRSNWTIGSFGADVAAVVMKLNLDNVVLIGHSMGGPVVIEAARRLQGRIVGLVGVDNFQNLSQVPTQEQVDGFVQAYRDDFRRNAQKFVRSMFPATVDSALADRIATDMSSAPPEIAVPAIIAALLYDHKPGLAEVRLPVRAINNDQYPTYAVDNRTVAASFEFKTMHAVGHFPHLVDPVTFNRLLRDMLADFWPEAAK